MWTNKKVIQLGQVTLYCDLITSYWDWVCELDAHSQREYLLLNSTQKLEMKQHSSYRNKN